MNDLQAVAREIAAGRYDDRIGWFDDARQQEPTRDPGLSVPCVCCGEAMTMENVGTVCVMAYDGTAERSLFYRMHRACRDARSDEDSGAMDWAVIERAPHLKTPALPGDFAAQAGSETDPNG
jgi:hypothetical protein